MCQCHHVTIQSRGMDLDSRETILQSTTLGKTKEGKFASYVFIITICCFQYQFFQWEEIQTGLSSTSANNYLLQQYLFENFQKCNTPSIGAIDDALRVLKAKTHHCRVDGGDWDAAGEKILGYYVSSQHSPIKLTLLAHCPSYQSPTTSYFQERKHYSCSSFSPNFLKYHKGEGI